jgi:uncharacterized RDD family membrane protein YckC
MYCSKCGSKLSEGVAFCQSCGQPVPNAPVISPTFSNAPTIPISESPAGGAVSVSPPVVYAPAQPGIIISPRPYAGFWLRLVAHVIDNILIFIVLAVIAGLWVLSVGVGYIRAQYGHLNPEDPSLPMMIIGWSFVALIAATLLQWLYFAGMESSEHQGTLGKMALGLIVTDLNDQRVSFARASGRFFAKIITNYTFLIGYIMAGFTEKKQALHDMIASTLVLRRL